MQQKWGTLILCVSFGLFAAGCPRGGGDYNQGLKAERLQDYDAALSYYQKAVKAEPNNATYKIRLHQARFDAGEFHIKRGLEMRKRGELDGAGIEFQKAVVADPSSSIAEQELKRTAEMIGERNHTSEPEAPTDHNQQPLASMPPEIKPLNRNAVNLKMSNDAKIVFDTIGKFAGLTMVYDPDFPARRITVDFNNVTLEQALEITALESKAVLKTVTENTLFVYPDQPQKRRDYEEEVVRTFYLSNVSQPQDITEIQTGLRQLFDLKRIQQVNSQSALIIRDTPDKLMLVQKLIDDIDKAKPEVIVQVEVLQASRDRLRELGVQPGSQASVAVTNGTTSSSSSGGGSTSNPITFDTFRHLNPNSFSVTLPSFTANLVENDSDTKIIQNPEIRSVDGQTAKLKIGQRIPVATGSFQAGVGVGGTGAAGFVNPLVNTQFTYLDVGVNVDITPRVHPNHEVSLKLRIEISSELTTVNIGGISQPVIGSKTIEHDIRLKEGEVNILGGLIERTDTKTISGWPGLARIPIFGRLFSDNKVDHQEDETLIVLTPHIVRMPDWTKANLRPMLSGTETFVQTRRESELRAPQPEQSQPAQPATQPQQPQQMPPATTTPTTASAASPSSQGPQAQSGGAVAKIRFEPQTLTLKAGQTATLGVVVENVNDLYSIPLLLQYDPKVISVEEVQHGGFLSGGGSQVIAIPWQVLKDKGQAIISATRPPSTPGVSGSGTLIGVVVKALAPGSTNLSIVQVNAKDSQQKAIPLVSSEATLQVQQ